MRRAAQTLLVSCAILCALTLSASSTIRLAASVDVPGWAHPFAVGLLEVTAVTGTWVWLTEPRVRWEAAGAVLMASTVTGIGGVLAYGAFGLVAPIGLIVTVHVIARAWAAGAAPSNRPVQNEETPATPPATEQPPTTGSQSLVVEPNQPEPGAAPQDLTADLRAWAAARGAMPGRDAVKARYGIGSSKADRLRDAAAKPDIRAVI